jgi:hypothetical protein
MSYQREGDIWRVNSRQINRLILSSANVILAPSANLTAARRIKLR